MAKSEKEIFDKNEFPSNSHNLKTSDRKVEKVVTGKVTKRKKSLGKKFVDVFIATETKNVGEYLIWDVIVPTIRDTIVDAGQNIIDMIFYGDKRSRNVQSNRGRSSYTSYGNYYSNSSIRESRTGQRNISRQNRSRHNFDEIIFASRAEAEDVLDHLIDLCVNYGMVSVADFYDLAGITSEFTEVDYGWVDLSNSEVIRARGGGFMINLPRTVSLKD